MTTLTFQNTALSVINQHNQTFITACDLSNALQYARPDNVLKIYERNADEFTAEMTALIEMPTAGGIQKVRIFSLRGAHLIAMFARTKVAKAFRKWVLDILDKEVAKQEQKTTVDDRTGLRNAVNMLVSKKGLIYSDAYNLVHQYMNVETIEDIPADKLQSAVEYVHKMVLEGELIETKPAPKADEPLLNEHDLQTVAWAAFIMARNADMFVEIYPALNALRSEFAPAVCGMAHEYRTVIKDIHALANRLTESIQYDYDSNWRVLKHIRNFNPKAKFYVSF